MVLFYNTFLVKEKFLTIMQDKGLHRLKGLAKARRGNGRPGIVPYEKYALAK